MLKPVAAKGLEWWELAVRLPSSPYAVSSMGLDFLGSRGAL